MYKEADELTGVGKYERTAVPMAIATVITIVNSSQPQEKFVWKYLSSKEFPLRLPALNDIAAEKAQLRKR